MKIIIVICDNFKQYRNYMYEQVAKLLPIYSVINSIGIFTINDTRYIPLYHKEDIRKLMGFEREGIEIRIIGDKAMYSFTVLRGESEVFGL